MAKWGLSPSAACGCGAASQTMEHIMTECDLYRPPISLENLNDTAVLDWLNMMSDIV